MPIVRRNYYPPAGAVIDQSEPRATWNGRNWVLNGRTYNPPSGHRLVGKPGGTHSGWTYDWRQRAWIEPDRKPATPFRPGGPPRPMPMPGRPMPMPPRPSVPSSPYPPTFVPTNPQETTAMTTMTTTTTQTPPNVLDYLVKHPVAPLAGAILIVGSMLTEEPVPPQIPAELPEQTAKQWQMIYAQNLQRFQRRSQMLESIGRTLLGYSEANAVLAALPAPIV